MVTLCYTTEIHRTLEINCNNFLKEKEKTGSSINDAGKTGKLHVKKKNEIKRFSGIPVVAQNLTGIHEDAGWIPGLAQWVMDLALP